MNLVLRAEPCWDETLSRVMTAIASPLSSRSHATIEEPKTVGKHLTAQDIEDVVRLLDGWTGKLTWRELCKACKPVIGTAPARQTLMKFSRISIAFKIRKGLPTLAEGSKESKPNLSASVYAKRLLRLEQENNRLAIENNRLLQQFMVWQYNANARGMSSSDLNCALPDTKQHSPLTR